MHEMRGSGIQTGIIIYNACISSCQKGAMWELALHLFGEVGRVGLQADVITFTSVISVLAQVGLWQLALRMLAEMGTGTARPNEFTYGAAIAAAGRAEQWEVALALLEEAKMAKSKASLSAGTCNAALSALEKGGEWQRALHLLGWMDASQVIPDGFSWNSCILAGNDHDQDAKKHVAPKSQVVKCR